MAKSVPEAGVATVVLSGFGFRSRNRKGETHSKNFQGKKRVPRKCDPKQRDEAKCLTRTGVLFIARQFSLIENGICLAKKSRTEGVIRHELYHVRSKPGPVRVGNGEPILKQTKTFLTDLWALTRPYWFSEERWAACGLLSVVIGLNLGLVYIRVLINLWNNDFYNTLQNLDQHGFYQQLLRFVLLAASYIVVAVYQLYLNQMLQIRWRRWLTSTYLDAWIGNRTYYRMQLADSGTDNPDQRIADDLALFCDRTLNLTLGLVSAVVTLGSFITILWGLSGAFRINIRSHALSIPGYMVWFALVYAVVGIWLTQIIGRPLIDLNFKQQKFEANFRFALVRIREHAEGIALYRGEADELRH
jgi:ABC-type uncharacterized transport system fused permease/ATPase subunit